MYNNIRDQVVPQKGDFISNKIFDVVGDSTHFINGEVIFSDCEHTDRIDNSYRTRYGWNIAHNGIILANSVHNIRYGMRRMTEAKPNLDGTPNIHRDSFLNTNQHSFFAQPEQKDSADRAAAYFASRIAEYTFTQTEDKTEWLDDNGVFDETPISALQAATQTNINNRMALVKHVKQRLRAQATHEYNNGLEYYLDPETQLVKSRVGYKVKRDEIAKPSKYIRMIGDLGVMASLMGAALTYAMKSIMETEGFAQEMSEKSHTSRFMKSPTTLKLAKCFETLIDSPSIESYYHSDDSCIAFETTHGRLVLNVDIAKCDKSHRAPIFEQLLLWTPSAYRWIMEICLKQLESDITINHPCKHCRVSVRLRPSERRLYSGSTLTTLINNVASYYLLISIARDSPAMYNLSLNLVKDACARSTEKVGYGCTFDVCTTDNIGEIQFLKYSPVHTHNHSTLINLGIPYYPFLNLGVLLRASGTCRGDLPGSNKVTLHKRAEQFQFQLVQGMYPRATSFVTEALKPLDNNLVLKQLAPTRYNQAEESDELPSVRFGNEVYERYSLSTDEIVSFEQELSSHARFGDELHHDVAARILNMDYGLTASDEPYVPDDLLCRQHIY
jgi:hypothetical protein